MKPSRIVDTNIVVRHVVQDDQRQAKTAGKLFEASDRGELTLVILPEVAAESVYVLESFYENERAEIARVLATLITSPGIEFDELATHLDALERYARTKLHFVDCVIAATAAARSLPIATFDKGFKKFGDVVVDVD